MFGKAPTSPKSRGRLACFNHYKDVKGLDDKKKAKDQNVYKRIYVQSAIARSIFRRQRCAKRTRSVVRCPSLILVQKTLRKYQYTGSIYWRSLGYVPRGMRWKEEKWRWDQHRHTEISVAGVRREFAGWLPSEKEISRTQPLGRSESHTFGIDQSLGYTKWKRDEQAAIVQRGPL